MGSLRSDIQTLLQQFLQEHENEETPAEMLAMFQQEANLLQETTLVHDALRNDNFECLMDNDALKKRLVKLLRVTDCHRVHTKDGYSHYTATVECQADEQMKGQGVASSVSLRFEYERHHHHYHMQQSTKPGDDNDKDDDDDDKMLVEGSMNDEPEEPPSVVYYIDLARDHGPSERMLWVQVFPAGLSPSNKPAMNMSSMMMDAENEGDDDDEWEDMSDEDDKEEESTTSSKPSSLGKRIREGTIEKPTKSQSNIEMKNVQDVLNETTSKTQQNDGDKNDNDEDDDDLSSIPDRYVAGIDPDVMARFLHWTQISLEDELAAFYFLMTFPFYEHEFHLIDYLLEAVFGPPDDDDDEGENDDDDDSL